MTARARWLLLVLSLLFGIGGLAFSGIVYTNQVDHHTRAELERSQREAQQDLCEMMRVFDDPNAPEPTTDRGRAQVAAIRSYLARRC
jgi:hypothetical protein